MEGLEDAVFETKSIQYKNSLLVPLYSRIKSMIKHLKDSEESRLLEDFENSKAHIMKNFRGAQQKEKLEKLTAICHKLLLTLRKDSLEPSNLIRELSKKFLTFYNVLNKWSAYTNIMKKGSHELFAEMGGNEYQTEYKPTDGSFKPMDYSSPDEKMTTEEEDAGDDFNLERLRLMMKKELSSLEKPNSGKNDMSHLLEDKDMVVG
jgi:hypothetical protein